MTEKNQIDARVAELLLEGLRALTKGKLKVASQFHKLAEEFMSAPLTMIGLVDTSYFSIGRTGH